MAGRMARFGPKGADLRWIARVVGERLRRLRDDRGLTQREAAARIGVGPPVLRRLEQGATNPSLAVLVSAARAFGVPLARLLRSR